MLFRSIYTPFVEHTAVSFERDAPSVEEMQRRIVSTLVQHPWLVCVEGEEVIGYAYAGKHSERHAYQWSVTVSVYIHSNHHRRGVGKALYTALFDILRRQGYYNAYAGITMPNPGSVGLHQSFGFEPVGVYRSVGFKFGKWHDVSWWQMPLLSPSTTPQDPIPLSLLATLSE